MFDKKAEFHIIDNKLNDIRIHCNRLQIPFIFVAAVHDDGNETEYRIAVDENQTVDEEKEYICQGLTPGSLGISLKNDKIRDIIKVLNGFKVVNSENPIPFDLGDFTVDAAAKASQGMYKQDDDGLFFDDVVFDENEDDGAIAAPTVKKEEPASPPQPQVRSSSVIQPLVEEQNPCSVTLHIGKNTDLPYIASDFE